MIKWLSPMMVLIIGAYPGSFNNSKTSFSETMFAPKSKAMPAIIKLPTNMPAVTMADKAKNLVKKEYFNGYFDCRAKITKYLLSVFCGCL